ncbi:MAG: ATP-binding cassette domain-containing protein [Elusimicrobia bacterium]|nr:ATP-binding cassette domain-containing protein [Elusimicrobiota bacterium]
MIEINDIKKVYRMGDEDLEVLKGVSLEIKQGEFVSIMGPSGSGKSTLMHILGLLDKPTSGSYKIFGKEVSNLSDAETAYLRAKIIGFVFQQFNLLSKMSALDNVALPQIYLYEKNDKEKAAALLKEVGLSDRLGHKPNQLSGGQQQRVAIARALVNNPSIIFADEPTGNLASDQSNEIMSVFKKLNEKGITVILVTHEPDIAAWADRIIKIKDGKIFEDTSKKAAAHIPDEKKHKLSVKSAFLNIQEVYENVNASLKSIFANKIRSFLTMLGIIIGVGSLIAMLAIGYGAQKAIQDSLSSLGANLLLVMPGNMAQGGISMGRGTVSRMKESHAEEIKNKFKYIKNTDSNVQGSLQVVYGQKNTRTTVLGATSAYPYMRNALPYYGRFFSKSEDQSMKKVALLGQTVVNNLFGSENPVGKIIKINRKNFTVIGILPAKGAAGMRDQDDMIVVPLNTAMKTLFGKEYVDLIWVETDTPESTKYAMSAIVSFMRKELGTGEGKEDPVSVMNMSDIQAMFSQTAKTFSVLLGIIAGISLIVGGIGIMNIMLVSVTERTKEIGLRKAIGATKRAILLQFLIEAVIVSVTGGLIGIGLGASAAFIIAKVAKWAVYVSTSSVLMSFGFSAAVGVIFGLWPAKKASELSPIEALRYE